MRLASFGLTLCLAAGAFAAAPAISNVSIAQAADARTATITYDLDADAYVTLELRAGDAPLAPEAYGGMGGNVNRLVAAGTGRKIVWRPDRAASQPADLAAVTPVLTAWHRDVPPPYMVVDLQGGGVAYHASTNEIPYGIKDKMYKTTHLVLAKIPAAGRTWMMGSAAGEQSTPRREIQRLVTFTNDYYMGIYEFTNGQWLQFLSSTPAKSHPYDDADVCPVDSCTYNAVRGGAFTAAPTASSLVGLLRTRTGLAFDLPTHAQWEVAARAGCTGLVIVPGAAMNDVAWTMSNYMSDPKVEAGVYTGNATHEVGLLLPNAFGLYDMQGNVLEMGCEALYDNRATQLLALGLTEETVKTEVQVEPQVTATSFTANGTTYTASLTVGRWAGAFRENAGNAHSVSRWAAYGGGAEVDTGFRVMCPAANGGRLED